uniref:Ig-like domain-containing protein n=1 Tax=Rhabditophanes sp. KR3021 TaxID=114890 RepID=A0AC35TQ13_9BILA
MTGYDKRVRPATSLEEDDTSGPVIVYVNYMIRMIFGINVKDNEYSMQITFREKWYDPRLAYDKYFAKNMPEFITVPHIRKQIWSPDTFFMTEKKAHGHAIDTENMFIRIYANGSVYYSTRLSMIISCPFMLHYYPMDTQFCDSDMGSYAHTATDIEYQWDNSVSSPIQIKSGVDQSLPNFLLVNYTVNRDCTHKTLTGVYSCLRLRLKLSRQFSYYLVQLYGPTAMIVVASWVSFWIDISSSAGRVSLSVMTLLTMTTLQSSINSKLPPVSYVKIVDIWLLSCQAFVFGALVEYAFVSYQDNKLKGKLAKKEELRKRQNRKGDEIHYEMPIGEGYFYQPQCTCSHNYVINLMFIMNCVYYLAIFLIPLINGQTTNVLTSTYVNIELNSIEWRAECFVDSRCSTPNFEMSSYVFGSEAIHRVQSPIVSRYVTKKQMLNIYFKELNIFDLLINSRVVGYDKHFKVDIACDQSSPIFIFKESPTNQNEMFVKLIGKCYEAQVSVSFFSKTIDESTKKEAQAQVPFYNKLIEWRNLVEDPFSLILIISLAILVVLCFILLVFLAKKPVHSNYKSYETYCSSHGTSTFNLEAEHSNYGVKDNLYKPKIEILNVSHLFQAERQSNNSSANTSLFGGIEGVIQSSDESLYYV